MGHTSTSTYLALPSGLALALLMGASCYVKPGTLDLPCMVDSECDAGQFCVLGKCASSPGGTDSDASTGEPTSTTAATTSTTGGTTTAGPLTTSSTTSSTSTSASETTMMVDPTSGSTGGDCPEGQVLVDGECEFPPCEDGACGDVSPAWVIRINSQEDELNGAPQDIHDIVTSADGMLYVIGYAYGVTEYAPGVTFGTAEKRVLFLAAYLSASGEFQWVKTVEVNDTVSNFHSVDFDETTNKLAIAGELDSTVDLDPSENNEQLFVNVARDGFVAQYTDAGEYDWHQPIRATGLQNARSVAYGTNNSLFVIGEYDADFKLLPPALPNADDGAENIYVAKLDKSDGDFVEVIGYGSADTKMRSRAISVGGNNSVTWAGEYTQTFTIADGVEAPDVGGSPAPVMVGLAGNSLDYSNFNVTPGAGGLVQSFAGLATAQARIYATAFFQGTLDFGDGPLESGDGLNSAIVGYTFPDLDWAQNIGDDEAQILGRVATNNDGSAILVGGTCGGTIDFGGGALTAVGHDDSCFAMLDEDGGHVWSVFLGGDNLPPGPGGNPPPFERGGAVTIASGGLAIVSGLFTDSLTIGDQTLMTDEGERVSYVIGLTSP